MTSYVRDMFLRTPLTPAGGAWLLAAVAGLCALVALALRPLLA